MALDPNISSRLRPLELPDPLAQMAQVSQFQASQQQQQLNKMKIEDLAADRKELNDLSVKLQDKGITPRQYMEMLRSSRNPERQKMGVEGLMRLDEQDKYGEVLKKVYPQLFAGGAEAPAVGMPTASATGMPTAPVSSIVRQPTAPIQNALGTGTYNMEPTAPVNALAPAPVAPANALINQQNTPAQLEMRIAMLAPFANRPGVKEQIAGFQSQLTELRKPIIGAAGSTIYSPTGQIIANVPPQPTVLERNYQLAKSQGFAGNIFDYERKLNEATRTPATPAQPSAPVAVVGDDGKIKYVSRDEAISKGMTPASAQEGLAPKEIQKREAALPQARQSVKTISNTMSVIGQTVDSLLANPQGIDGITGLVYGVTPAITNAARKAKAELEQLKNLAFIQGITELRAASKTGAAVGNVTNREGDRFENLKASLDRSQSSGDLTAALKKLKQQAELTSQFTTEAFDDTYSYKSAAPAAPAAGQGTGGFKYLGKENK